MNPSVQSSGRAGQGKRGCWRPRGPKAPVIFRGAFCGKGPQARPWPPGRGRDSPAQATASCAFRARAAVIPEPRARQGPSESRARPQGNPRLQGSWEGRGSFWGQRRCRWVQREQECEGQASPRLGMQHENWGGHIPDAPVQGRRFGPREGLQGACQGATAQEHSAGTRASLMAWAWDPRCRHPSLGSCTHRPGQQRISPAEVHGIGREQRLTEILEVPQRL